MMAKVRDNVMNFTQKMSKIHSLLHKIGASSLREAPNLHKTTQNTTFLHQNRKKLPNYDIPATLISINWENSCVYDPRMVHYVCGWELQIKSRSWQVEDSWKDNGVLACRLIGKGRSSLVKCLGEKPIILNYSLRGWKNPVLLARTQKMCYNEFVDKRIDSSCGVAELRYRGQ